MEDSKQKVYGRHGDSLEGEVDMIGMGEEGRKHEKKESKKEEREEHE